MNRRRPSLPATRLRAPQFAIGGLLDENAASEPAAEPPAWEASFLARQPPVSQAQVVVRRQRRVEIPAEPAPGEDLAPALDRAPRTFVVGREDGAAELAVPEAPERIEAAAAVDERSDADDASLPLPAPTRAIRRRKRKPEYCAPGEVTIVRPLAAIDARLPAVSEDVSLRQLERELAAASSTLESLRANPYEIKIDLTAASRWARIERDLEGLRETLPPSHRTVRILKD